MEEAYIERSMFQKELPANMIKQEPASPASDISHVHSPCSEASSALSDADTSHLTPTDMKAFEILFGGVRDNGDDQTENNNDMSYQNNHGDINLAEAQFEEVSIDESVSVSNVLERVNSMNGYSYPPPPYPGVGESFRVPPTDQQYYQPHHHPDEYVNYDQITDSTLRSMLQKPQQEHVPTECQYPTQPASTDLPYRRVSCDKENSSNEGKVRKRCSLKSMPVEQRKARRREQNRLAAQRCRQRKKVCSVDVEEQYREEFNKFTQLREEVDVIKEERDRLQRILNDHITTGCPSGAHAHQQSNSSFTLPFDASQR